MNRYLQAGALLAAEAFVRPSWAFYHVWGYLDERLLLRFYRADRSEQRKRLWSLKEVLAGVCGADQGIIIQRMMKVTPSGNSGHTSEMATSPIPIRSEASLELQQLVFSLTFLCRPDTVVEVGVGRGATTRAILLALEESQKGHLYSIDFPALRRGYAQQIGILVPEPLRARWTLILGPSQRELRRLLQKLRIVDLFVHDGAHSYHIQRADYERAVHHLRPGGLLISDDVNNRSFWEVAVMNRLDQFLIRQSKKDPIGMAVKRCAQS